MLLQKFKILFFSELESSYPNTEIQSFFNILSEFQLNMSRVDLALQPAYELTSSNLAYFKDALEELKQYMPIQYIIGETLFYGLNFKVNRNVLIPRPETEELVDWILKDSKETDQLSILDIGTGSGCIPVSLAKNLPNADVAAIDISDKALNLAKENARLNDVSIHFTEKDILTTQSLASNYDIIVSNPPYVRDLEKNEMQENVLEHEPHTALFVENDDPLLFYDKISELALQHLNKNGSIYFEINQYLGKETSDLLKKKGFTSIEIRKDLFGNDRMIKAKR